MVLAQLLTNGLIVGSFYALVALGFCLVYGTTRTFHFAYGSLFSATAYIFYLLAVPLGLPLWVAFVLTVGCGAALGAGTEKWVYTPLRLLDSSPMVIMLSSLGLAIVVENLLAAVFTTDVRPISADVLARGFSVGPARLTLVQVGMIGSLAVLWPALYLLLTRTRLGSAIRALASDAEMTDLIGVETSRLRLVIYALGTVLATVASVLTALDVGTQPYMGLTAVLTATVAMIVGGAGNLTGAALGGLLLGLVENLSVTFIEVQWQTAIAFVVVLLFIVFRPTGILGQRLV